MTTQVDGGDLPVGSYSGPTGNGMIGFPSSDIPVGFPTIPYPGGGLLGFKPGLLPNGLFYGTGITIGLSIGGRVMMEATQNVAKHVSVVLRDATGAGVAISAGMLASFVYSLKKGGQTTYSTITPVATVVGTTGRLDLAFTASHLDTIGEAALNVTGLGILPNDDLTIDVIAVNKNDAVRAGLTALPNAAAGASGGLPAIDANLNVAADLKRWIGTVPASVTASGYVQTALLRWLTDNAAGTPLGLSTNGLVQTLLLRWLTDDSGGTPNALVTGDMPSDVTQWKGVVPDSLSSGKLPADVKLWLTAAPATLSTNGFVKSVLLRWLTDDVGGTPNALTAGQVDSTGSGGGGGATAEEVADAIMAFVLRAGAGADPDSTVLGHMRRMDALFFGKVTGLLSALVRGYQPGGETIEYSVSQDATSGTREEADRTTSETP